MRAGRFGDRIIEIPLPDKTALCGIFRHHLAGDLASVDLLPFARSAAGANGADVAAFVRSARRLARNEGRPLHADDLLKQILPEDVRSVPDIRLAAYHEAGHCVAAIVLMGQRVEYVSIVQKRGSGGQTASATLGTDFPTREILEARVLVLLCGRAAEEVCIGAPSIGCSISEKSDLSRGTDLVLGMHAAWGLGRTPMVHAQFTDTSALLLTNDDLRRTVEEHIAALYKRALAFISDNTRAIEAVAERLMVARRIEWTEIDSIMQSIRAATVKSVASASIVPDAGDPAPNGKAKSQARRFDP
jgi:ATP-dependent Zn protease